MAVPGQTWDDRDQTRAPAGIFRPRDENPNVLMTQPTEMGSRGFGVLIVFLVIGGSIWIIANLNENMLPMRSCVTLGVCRVKLIVDETDSVLSLCWFRARSAPIFPSNKVPSL